VSEIIVRHLDRADRPVLRRWFADPVIRAAVTDETVRPDRLSATLAMLESSDPRRKGDLCLVIEKDGRPIGLIHFVWINWTSRNAEALVFIGPEEQRGSLAAFKAVAKIGEAAFDDLNLHKVYAFIYGSNPASLGLFRRVMRTEACFRRYLKSGRGYEDVFLLGLLASDYRRHRDRFARRAAVPAEVRS
jgi:RimJ/RimL family protein N-acetyltransferase